MELLLVIGAMILVGLVMGFVAGLIWKESRPIGVTGDYAVAVAATVVTGLLDFYVIPAMGFSDNLKWVGIALEPPLAALLVLWLIRKARAYA